MKNYILATGAIALAAVGLFAFANANANKADASIQVCSNPSKSDLTDFNGTNSYYLVGSKMDTVQIKNNSVSCSFEVGIASYQSYKPYSTGSDKSWIYSQTFYQGKTIILQPGQSWTYKIATPSCAYQVDIFWGDLLKSFPDNAHTYSGQGRFLDGYWYPGAPGDTQLALCVAKPTPVVTAKPTPVVTAKPTPVVTAKPTPVVTAKPTPVVTAKPTPVVTVKPTPVVTVNPTPVVTPAPTGEVLAATTTPTPIAQLPSTGPGPEIFVSLIGIAGALVTRKLL